MSWLLTLPNAVGLVLLPAVTIALGLTVYGAAWLALGRYADARSTVLATALFRVIGILLSLLLSLAFSGVIADREKVRAAIALEAAQLSHTLSDLDAFGSEEAEAVEQQLLDYIDFVKEQEWELLRRGVISAESVNTFSQLKLGIFSLEAQTPLQRRLGEQLIVDISAVNTTRAMRLQYRGNDGGPMFLAITVVCFVFTVVLIGFYSPTWVTMVIIAVYCAFFGALVHVILSLGAHFSGIGAITPEALEAISRQVRQMQ